MRDKLDDTMIDLGDAVVDTKGTAIGLPDVGAGQRSFEGMSSDD